MGTGVDEVGDGLGLGEVELVVEVGAAGELTRLRASGAELDGPLDQCRKHRRTAVAVQLEHRLAGVGMGRREVEHETGIDRLTGAVAEGREGREAGFGQAPRQQPGGDFRHPRPRQADHADAATAGRGGGSDDGVGGVDWGHLWNNKGLKPVYCTV